MASRKHYESIAEILSFARSLARDSYHKQLIESAAQELCTELHAMNDRFDHEVFMRRVREDPCDSVDFYQSW